ncbi:MAG: hypothetical protein ABIO65_08130 [Nitrospiria bacterium]
MTSLARVLAIATLSSIVFVAVTAAQERLPDTAAPPTAAGELEFDREAIPEENIVPVAESKTSASMWGWVALSILLGIGMVAGLSAAAIRRWGDRIRFPFGVADLPASARVMCTLALLVLGLVHLFGAATAYVMSQVVNTSAEEYYFYMKIGKLMGVTHAHLFGTMLMHLVVAAVFILTDVRESFKVVLITATMLGSPLDIAAWWLIKYVSPLFEALAWAGEMTSEAGYLTMTLIALYQLWRPETRLAGKEARR